MFTIIPNAQELTAPVNLNDVDTIAMSWQLLELGVNLISTSLRQHGSFEAIIPISRGGLVPATMLSHRLGVRTIIPVQAMRTASNKRADYCEPKPITAPDIEEGIRTLIVEDIIYKGVTLSAIAELVFERTKVTPTLAALVMDAEFPKECNVGQIDAMLTTAFSCRHNIWVRFPWELSIENEVVCYVSSPTC